MLRTQRYCSLTSLPLASLLILTSSLAAGQTKIQPGPTPVLVELFTAEGCSSCPPADALLAQLASQQPVAGVNIIALGEHVDYWDQSGWRDRFSSPQYTARQHGYGFRFKINDIYTPEMVVDGAEQFVGNDGAHALSAIAHAGQTTKTALVLSKPEVKDHRVTIAVSLAAPADTLPKADLYAALIDSTDVTNIGGGENRGLQLHHAAVVRTLQRIGKLKDLASHPIKASLTVPHDAVVGNMRVVVFAQSSGQGPVVGVTEAPIAQ